MCAVRLTPAQILTITQTVSRLTDGTADIFLFGSRLDDLARGGDVDLLIETDTPLSLLERARIKMELERLIALPVDIVAHGRESAPTPFQRIVRSNAIRLQESQP